MSRLVRQPIALLHRVERRALRSWADFVSWCRDPYRPELHYMRGPGPRWRAAHPDEAELSQDHTAAA